MPPEKPREIALRIFLAHAKGKGYAETLIANQFQRRNIPERDRRLVCQLVYGTIRLKRVLNWFLAQHTRRSKMPHRIRAVLHLGLYQLFWLDRVPDHAATHESVSLARSIGPASHVKFVNAIMRRCLAEKDRLLSRLDRLKTQDPALGHSHPQWLFKRWEQRWERSQAIALLQWNNQPAPSFLRINRLKADRDQAAQGLQAMGLTFRRRHFEWAPETPMLETDHVSPALHDPAFLQGAFYIQDPSTLLAVHALDPQPGDRVLDFCAAPGGKTTYAAQRMENRGLIAVQDHEGNRMGKLRENCARLGVTCVEGLASLDARFPRHKPEFDRVLVDVPCSNTGVIRRRVDVRWRLQPRDLDRLRSLQRELLDSAARRTRPGGWLVYSTCSLERDENEDIVGEFLSQHPGFSLDFQRTLTPFQDQVDGAFVARLRRTGSLIITKPSDAQRAPGSSDHIPMI